jgi:hypothetical protein
MAENDVEYTKPNSQLDAERRLAEEKGEAEPFSTAARSFAVEGNDLSQYVGVSPEYQNYAEETHKPGEFAEVEGELVERQKQALSTDVPEGVDNIRRVEKVEEVEVDPAERVEPKQATFNIPAVTNDGKVSGDSGPAKAATQTEKKAAKPAAE